MKRFLILCSIIIGATSMQAQIEKFDAGLQWTLKEKIKLSPKQIQEFYEGMSKEKLEDLGVDYKLLRASGEINLTNSSEVESEIHAAINPADSNNIVVSPIRQDYANGNIWCPIYYTKDFGDNWGISSFTNMPYEPTAISGGGGDPVFAFDKNGRLYFSWIDLYGDQSAFMAGSVNMGIFWAYSDDGGETWTKPVHDTILLGEMQMVFGMPIGINSPISDKQWMATDKTNSTYQNNLYVSYVTIGDDGNGGSTYQILCKTKPAGVLEFIQEAAVSDTANFELVQFSSLNVDNNGNVHVVFYGIDNSQNSGLWHSVSTDGGANFSTPNLVSNIRFNLPMAQVTPYDTISGIKSDRTYPSPYMSADQNSGKIYLTWTAFGINSLLGNGADIYFSKSDDNGATWSTPMIINDDQPGQGTHNYYSSIFVGDDGQIKVSWYDRRDDPTNNINSHYYYATSTDDGQTFSTNYPASTLQSDFNQIGNENQGFGVGEYTQVLATSSYTIPVWADGRTNDGNINVYISFINDNTTETEEIKTIHPGFYVKDVYPNPSTSTANIDFEIPEKSEVKINIVDINGKLIKSVKETNFNKGKHHVNFNINDIETGNYFVTLQANTGFVAKSLIVE